MKLYLRLGLCVWGILACLVVNGQTLRATWLLGPSQDSLNTHIFTRTAILHVEAPENVQLLWPEIKDSLGSLEILSSSEVIQTSEAIGSGNASFDQTFSLIAWEPGFYQIPSVDIQAIAANGDTLSTFASSMSLDVQIALADTSAKIEPIKGIQEAPITLTEILTWAGLALVVILVIAVIVYLVVRNRKQAPIIPERKAPIIPAHEIAMRSLDRLEAEKKWQNGDIKGYYIGLSDILREYMEGAFHFPAKESVTEEIIEALEHQELPRNITPKVREFLVQADFTKFAKSHPDPQTNLDNMDFARRFVKETHAFLELQKKAQESIHSEEPTLETRT